MGIEIRAAFSCESTWGLTANDHEEMLCGDEIFYIFFGALFFAGKQTTRVSSLKHRCNSAIFAGLGGVVLGLCNMYGGYPMSGVLSYSMTITEADFLRARSEPITALFLPHSIGQMKSRPDAEEGKWISSLDVGSGRYI